jgi:hypothetical protein
MTKPSAVVHLRKQAFRRIESCASNIVDGTRIHMKHSTEMEPPSEENSALVKNSVLYKEFIAEREEILRHKWLESEKSGHDIGFEKALLDWIVKYRSTWREKRQKQANS